MAISVPTGIGGGSELSILPQPVDNTTLGFAAGRSGEGRTLRCGFSIERAHHRRPSGRKTGNHCCQWSWRHFSVWRNGFPDERNNIRVREEGQTARRTLARRRRVLSVFSNSAPKTQLTRFI